MSTQEQVVAIACEGSRLCGILHLPRQPKRRGVLVVVGGPQYRVGSHRQFVLLARRLADAGYPSLRFDYRGMGDSEGDPRTFEDINLDIHAAIDAFFETADIAEVVIWGLCDASSAALFYAGMDRRVTGLVLLNPWVRTEGSLAKTYVRHYYLARFVSADFWRKVFSGRYEVGKSMNSFIANLKAMSRSKSTSDARPPEESPERPAPESLPDRMANGLERFEGEALFILSGQDLTAKEFDEVCRRSKRWTQLLRRGTVSLAREPEADHTFSRNDLRLRVENRTIEWLEAW